MCIRDRFKTMLQQRVLGLIRKIPLRTIIISKSNSDPQKRSEYESQYSAIMQNIADHNQKLWDNSPGYKKEKINNVLKALDEMNQDEKHYLKFLILRDSLETSINNGLSNAVETNWNLSLFAEPKNSFDNLHENMTISSFLSASSCSEGSSSVSVSSEGAQEKTKEVEEEVVSVKTKFSVKLVEVPAAKKLVTIKEVKAILGIGLKDAKDMVENLPAELKADAEEEEIQKLKDKFEAIGCTLEVV